jgi:hypothetical protein
MIPSIVASANSRPRVHLVALAVLALLSAPAVQALPVHVAVLGGAGFSHLAGVHSPVVEFKGIKAASYGLSLRIALRDRLELEPQLLAVTDGLSLGTVEGTDQAGNPTGTLETLHVQDRLQVPVLLRFTPLPTPRIRPFAFGGPYAAMRLREYDRTTGSVSRTDKNDALKFSEYGVTVGAGLQTRLGPGHIELQARYDLALTDLGQYLGVGRARTRAIRVLTGYSF